MEWFQYWLDKNEDGITIYVACVSGVAILLLLIQLLVMQNQRFEMRKQAALLEAAQSGKIAVNININGRGDK